MKNYYRTDLASESLPDASKAELAGYTKTVSTHGLEIERMKLSEREANETGKPAGSYVTVNCGKLRELDGEARDELISIISDELKKFAEGLSGRRLSGDFTVLVAGLGNAEMTPDAIGPGTVSRITVTRHLADAEPELFSKLGCCRVAACAPGVLGQTGIETSELIRGAVGSSKPDVVLAVDALAARSCERLAATVQLSDTGIFPGSGVGNRRGALCRETLGVPVMSIGVPTVVDSSTLVYDALGRAGINQFGDELKKVLDNGRSYFVAPKECDVITRNVCRVLACAVNDAFGINLGDEA